MKLDLQCDYSNQGTYLKEDYPITTFFDNKRFPNFFANRPINNSQNVKSVS